MTHYPTAANADVGLLLEGTYPFVRGGVSTWVKQIIEGMPELTFAIIFLGSVPEDYKQGMRYRLPPNVVHLEVHYLFGGSEKSHQVEECKGNPVAFSQSAKFHETLRQKNNDELQQAVQRLDFYLNHSSGIDEKQFYYSRESWQYICEMYEKHCTDPSFVDYFWTIRNLHRPIWRLAQIVADAPKVKVLHSISTGYAGFLGSMMHYHTASPLMISEHGIYTKERRIDLLQNQWNRDKTKTGGDATQIDYQRQLWVRFFESLARMAYTAAEPIVSLFGEYRKQQIIDGAEEERTRIIPNGVDLAALRPLIDKRSNDVPKVMCLLGRVVPIKDVKTFIRSVSVVAKAIPDIQAWIVGPDEENPEYAQECHNLVHSMGLGDNVSFKGMQRIDDVLPHIGLMVLSSISEGLPLVILEAYAAGVPVVTTDVGACRELVYGRDDNDKAMGAAGRVVNIADPQALGEATIELLTDENAWRQAQLVGLERVQAYYDIATMLSDYKQLYKNLMSD